MSLWLLAPAAEAGEPLLHAACGARAELDRAGAALAAGDRARAERHVHRAEARLAACAATSEVDPAYARASARAALPQRAPGAAREAAGRR
jgi:hypothetical protein